VEGDNHRTERKVNKGIDKTADFAFAAKVNKKLRPNSRLKNVRQSDDKEGNDGDFLNGYFHLFIVFLV
jgi:hypothetical protein